MSEFGRLCKRIKLRVNVGKSKVMSCSRYGKGGRMHVSDAKKTCFFLLRFFLKVFFVFFCFYFIIIIFFLICLLIKYFIKMYSIDMNHMCISLGNG